MLDYKYRKYMTLSNNGIQLQKNNLQNLECHCTSSEYSPSSYTESSIRQYLNWSKEPP